MPNKPLIATDITCPKCKKHKLLLQISQSGNFLTCSAYKEKGEQQCKNTVGLLTVDEKDLISHEQDATKDHDHQRCPKCNSKLDTYFINATTKLLICSNVPSCDYNKQETGHFFKVAESTADWSCDKCGTKMELQIGQFGKYARCPNCDNSRSILSSGELAPPKPPTVAFPELPCSDGKSHFVLRRSAAGIFFGANTFPKSREMRTIDVATFKQFENRIPEDLKYLATGPLEDNLGNPTFIRYSKKDQQQYIGSQHNNVFTKFRADYQDGKWVVVSEAKEAKETKETTASATKSKTSRNTAKATTKTTTKATTKTATKTTRTKSKKAA